MTALPGILRFDEGYFEKIWGGRKLETEFGKPIPPRKPIGEAWLVADHPQHVSTVIEGPLKGVTLRHLIESNAEALLGRRAKPTIHGRFPLLLKILDAADYLSVQVHPNDEDAIHFNEPDVGKTEMWQVLQADPGSELICGMPESVDRTAFDAAIHDGSISNLLTHFPALPGTSVFVPAGTVHAIGAGILLAEIQQNSDITYRVYDWGRIQDNGQSRELHIDKSAGVTHFGSRHAGPARPLSYTDGEARRTVLGACQYFAGESIDIDGEYRRETRGDSFHLLLVTNGSIRFLGGDAECGATPGTAVLIPGAQTNWVATGTGTFSDYYVPDLHRDIVDPLTRAGFGMESIVVLGGDASTSDISGVRTR